MSKSDIDSKIDQAVNKLFEKYDADKSGWLEDGEITKIIQDVFSHLNEHRTLTNEDVKKVMVALDKNSDGKISKDELREMIVRCMSKK